jgi:hypothetical protein
MSSEKVNKYLRMLDDPDHRMRAIQKLEALGAEASDAIPNLWNLIVNNEGGPQLEQSDEVRAAALKTIVTIGNANPETVERLTKRLDASEPDLRVKLQAVQSLESFGGTIKSELPKLWGILNNERHRTLRAALAKAIISIDANEEGLFERAIRSIQNLDQQLWATTAILSELELSKAKTNKSLGILWELIETNPSTNVVDALFLAIVDITADDDRVLEKLLNDDKLSNQTRVFAIIEPKLWNNVGEAFRSFNNPRLLSAMLGALRLDDKDIDIEIRRNVILLLKEGPIDKGALSEVFTVVQRLLEETGLGLGLIYKHDPETARQWLRNHRKPFPGVGEFLLFEADDNFWDEQWEMDPVATLWHVITVITDSNLAGWQNTDAYRVLDKLNAKRSEISRELCEQIRSSLLDAKAKASKDSLREFLVVQALESIQNRLNQIYHKDIGKVEDEEEQIKKIKQLVRSESTEVLQDLVEVWVKWIINNDHPTVVERTASGMRENPLAVAPLVDQLAKNVALDPKIRTWVLKEIGSQSQIVHDYLDKLLKSEIQEDQITPAQERSIREWLEGFENKSGEFAELFQTARDKYWSTSRQALHLVGLLEQQKHNEREQLRYRRITQQLANMSDARFFQDAHLLERIQDELVKHAVPVLARRLPVETDIVAREHLARALANLSGHRDGREAVDALVRAVVDDEKKRAARQDLLAKYYLEPSKQQSDDAAKLLSSAVADAKNTLRILQRLNITVVVVGIFLLLIGVVTSLVSKDLSTRVIGALAGLGGLAGVIIQLINNPLDRIQNAMANLVQIETAFTSFIWELNLNGTYIQSQYVAEGILTNDEIGQTVNRIEGAMGLAMNLVAVYTEEGRQRVVTRINSISPAAGKIGSKVVIHGYHLQGNSDQKKKQRSGTIAINHKPIDAQVVTWTDDQVNFTLASPLPGLEGNTGTVWISLSIDGLETNALPFYVTD